jgi:hypothetical protein
MRSRWNWGTTGDWVCTAILWAIVAYLAFLVGVPNLSGQTRESAKALYVFLARAEMTSPAPAPAPTPEPVSDTCENCNGRGKVGDGTVMVVCPECDGTGKKRKAADIAEIKAVEGWPPKHELQIIEATPRFKTNINGFDMTDYPGDYKPRWTWPGDLESHLLQAPHHFDSSNLTQDQREMYHDKWHDKFGDR